MTALRIEHLNRAFGSLVVTDDVSLEIAPGQRHVIIGPNGAGTLIGPVIGTGVFLLMKNVVSSYNEHWLAIIGITFICCVMFFPAGIWGAVRDFRMRKPRP